MNTESLFLRPGEIYFGNDVNEITTILGSCVAVTLIHRSKSIIGLCHIQYPTITTSKDNFGYPENAIRFFSESIRNYHTLSVDYDISIFGGGRMFPGIDIENRVGIGEKNGKVVIETLTQYGFKIGASDIGGEKARKLRLSRTTGVVKCEYIKATY